MQRKANKPIFVVGSRVYERASSLRVWVTIRICFPCQSQNGWGDFAVNVAIAYQIGAARGDHSILSAMEIGDSELFAAFGQSIDDLILRHRTDLETKREIRTIELKLEPRWLEATSIAAGPRHVRFMERRSIPCTYAMRKLFPQALYQAVIADPKLVQTTCVRLRCG
jgi:hypothetical protein